MTQHIFIHIYDDGQLDLDATWYMLKPNIKQRIIKHLQKECKLVEYENNFMW